MSLRPHATSCDVTQCGNYENLLSSFSGKNFVKATHLLNREIVDLTKYFFGESKFLVFPHFEDYYAKLNFDLHLKNMVEKISRLKNFCCISLPGGVCHFLCKYVD